MMSDLPLSNMQSLSISPQDSATKSPIGSGEQFLRLRLVGNLPILLPIQQLTEVLTIPESQVIPIPHMPAWVMGVYNWRGEILWMIDLGHLCGLDPWYQHSTNRSAHPAVVLNITAPTHPALSKGQMLGLVVNQVEDIDWCKPDAVQSLPSSTTGAKPILFAKGYWQKTENETLAILDGKTILDAISR